MKSNVSGFIREFWLYERGINFSELKEKETGEKSERLWKGRSLGISYFIKNIDYNRVSKWKEKGEKKKKQDFALNNLKPSQLTLTLKESFWDEVS